MDHAIEGFQHRHVEEHLREPYLVHTRTRNLVHPTQANDAQSGLGSSDDSFNAVIGGFPFTEQPVKWGRFW